MRIILDTNLWISFLISSKYSRLDNLLFNDKCTLLFSDELLEEFVEVCKRPKLRKYISAAEIEDILDTIDQVAVFIDVKSNVSVCRDLKDNFLLELAKDGKADYLLTGDADLLVIEEYEGTKIMNLTDFLSQVFE